jgi:hypothetical protein
LLSSWNLEHPEWIHELQENSFVPWIMSCNDLLIFCSCNWHSELPPELLSSVHGVPSSENLTSELYVGSYWFCLKIIFSSVSPKFPQLNLQIIPLKFSWAINSISVEFCSALTAADNQKLWIFQVMNYWHLLNQATLSHLCFGVLKSLESRFYLSKYWCTSQVYLWWDFVFYEYINQMKTLCHLSNFFSLNLTL